MQHRTVHRLQEIADPHLFERLVLDVLSAVGHPGLVRRDLHLVDSATDGQTYHCPTTRSWVVFSLVRQWKSRFRRDFERVMDSRRPVETFYFCCSRPIPPREIRAAVLDVEDRRGVRVQVLDAVEIARALDTIATDIREIYLDIPDNATVRRSLRYLLSDPEGEMPEAAGPTESLFDECRLARGIYSLLRQADLADECESPAEVDALTRTMDAHVRFRRAARGIERFVRSRVEEDLGDGASEHQAAALIRAGLVPPSEPVQIAPSLQPLADSLGHSLRYLDLLEEVREGVDACRVAVAAVTAISTLTTPPRLDDFGSLPAETGLPSMETSE